MPMEYNAHIVVGLRIKSRKQTKEVTKYNEDTGVPYQKKIEETVYSTYEDRNVNFNVDELRDEGNDILRFYPDGHEPNLCFIGHPVASVGQRMYWFNQLPDESMLTEVRTHVRKALRKRGCEVEPQVFIVLSYG